MIGFAKLLRHAKSSLAVVFQEAKKFVSGDEIGLRGFNHIGCELITSSCDRGGQAENFSGFGNPQDQGLAIRGRGGKLDSSAAENKDTASRLTFDEQGSSFGIGGGRSDGSHRFHCGVRQIAK